MKKKESNNHIEGCAIRNVLDRFGDKWSMLIIYLLSDKYSLKGKGKMRFGELQKEIGSISQKMLTVSLRSLEADGLILRKAYAEIPPRVEYRLTRLGKSLVPHMANLSKWAEENQDKILKSRSLYN
ncbi:MAG: helix-turn-helix transcriptional regulator [Gammaproteobacteria bacterium]|nr:helix-turn-helix transcriptional regulator [Gammaproteobacteria bacterium]MBT3725375.1 helix-turn-helix transcriptional regulator [Gammaproteobacteria bacterium]MBT4078606.1 helix-turn-helix transcriptional regulator [Gammaproteobacteria bacterium]MBT4193689.1 helix-turn-helix transcriptional regulator [Gammaproteobacteria bacterium]MBT4451011.1 helix-turn-helix transcriptional regulator [Gammaproteobacteria bacterium]